jgi:hypothetical protein
MKKMMFITCVKINPGKTEEARKFGEVLAGLSHTRQV